MESGAESLAALNALLEEFFDYNTSNGRKQEIEHILGSFSGQQDAWRQCVYFMTNSSNQYVNMFCLATIETVITKQWLRLHWEERSELRSLLYQHTLANHAKVPAFIRNKLLKLIVDIARSDWPHFYPDFFSNITALIENGNVLLGLALLQTASEELICPREDVSVARKDELRRLLLAHIPQVFSILAGTLEGVKTRQSGNSGADGVCQAALQALSHLFSWVPLTHVNDHHLLNLVTHFALQPDSCGVLAVCCINELLYKNCVPPSFLDALVTLCRHGNQLLRATLSNDLNDKTSASAPFLSEYMAKLTELARLCVSLHWHRIETSLQHFPVLDFLSTLFQFTFRPQLSLDMFYSCLEVWIALLDYLYGKEAAHIHRYEEVLVSLVHSLLKKLHSEHDLDDSSADDDDKTERQKFLHQCIEVMAKVAELSPSTSSIVVSSWRTNCDVYERLLLVSSPLPPPSPTIGLMLLDCATSMQALGRLQPVPAPNLLPTLARLAATATARRLHRNPDVRHVRDQLIQLHAEMLACLQACLRGLEEDGPQQLAILEDAARACLPLLGTASEDGEAPPPRLQHAAAHLLATVLNTPRPPALIPTFLPAFQLPLHHLPKETQSVVRCGLCRCLLTWQWGEVVGSDRAQLLAQLVVSMAPSGVNEPSQLTALLLHCKPDNKQRKKLLFNALQPLLMEVVSEFPRHFKERPELCDELLGFYLEAFRTLQEQMGAEFTQQAVQAFISCFTSGGAMLNKACGADKLLQLLMLIVQQPGSLFKHFVPSCIDLSVRHMYPAIADTASPHIKPALFQLLTSILLHKWQYFYAGTVRDGQPMLEHGDELAAILQAFGQSLTQTDIGIFAQNLHALESLNHKWKLYHKELFRGQFLATFLTVLLNTLVDKSQALLADDIASASYNMAAVDFDTFYASFVPHFLAQTDGLDVSQRGILQANMKPNTDLPSFVQNILRLANDIRCYRLCNCGTAS